MDRHSLRVSDRTKERVDRLVESGEYPNISEVYRAALRELFARYDFEADPPTLKPADRSGIIISANQPSDAARARAASLLSSLWGRPDGSAPVIIFDEPGVTDGLVTPPNTHVVHSSDEFAEAVENAP